MKEWFYIRFDYDHWCQGYEKATETLMVQAVNFKGACEVIEDKYTNARFFEDLTLRQISPSF